jgi:hypothetical protein
MKARLLARIAAESPSRATCLWGGHTNGLHPDADLFDIAIKAILSHLLD